MKYGSGNRRILVCDSQVRFVKQVPQHEQTAFAALRYGIRLTLESSCSIELYRRPASRSCPQDHLRQEIDVSALTTIADRIGRLIMAIDMNEITSDLTLEIDEEVISIADFGKAFDNFSALVKEVSKGTVPKKNAGAWSVKVYPGSAAIGLSRLDTEFSLEEANAIRLSILDGLKKLAKGIRPIQFTDKAIEHSKQLASLFKARAVQPTVRIWSKKEESFAVTREMATHAGEMLNAAYEEDGTVDGILEKLDAHGKLQFVIYDVIDERSVKCEVDEQQLAEAWGSFRKRVEVVGKVRYRKDGMPVSIKASRIIPFPEPSQVPNLQQMRNLLAGN